MTVQYIIGSRPGALMVLRHLQLPAVRPWPLHSMQRLMWDGKCKFSRRINRIGPYMAESGLPHNDTAEKTSKAPTGEQSMA